MRMFRSLAKFSKGSIWLSFTPRITTQLSFTSKPNATAFSMPSSIFPRLRRLLIRKNGSGSSASNEMFSEVSPAPA